ncbi:MAG: hypothetical protein DI598_01360 [Pseudopedobacter saltans]|uniref:PKD domain-containing protein n=1 Tax=Pseudopedobacter saltans TaxID=151895 RepID=A0A2W5H9P5_9SPHI|nr:MAG: hypothetical protein DI598_01360 [Pseudopedobacter saltans]
MKKIALLFVLVILSFPVLATHIKGGWIGYQYLRSNATNDSSEYQIDAYIYSNCNFSYPNSLTISVYDLKTNSEINSITLLPTAIEQTTKKSFNHCIINPPYMCYNIWSHKVFFKLKNNPNGYIIAAQSYARIGGIVNINRSDDAGMTLYAIIPGSNDDPNKDYHANSSPQFGFRDTSVVCYNSKFDIVFSASDPDGDSLSYYFDNGLNGSAYTSPPPYLPLNYIAPYSGKFPMGPEVAIDPKTGIISGIAPATVGEYVVAVYAQEWRKGVLINTTKKELQINVSNCNLLAAYLEPSYINCVDKTFKFKNRVAGLSNASYLWNFGDSTQAYNTSTEASPTFTYSDTGTYTLKLKTASSLDCTDSTTAEVKVYPGFFPEFEMENNCIEKSSDFNDKTVTKNGFVNSWNWDFGDNKSSQEQSPQHTFDKIGKYDVKLIVSNSKGCQDSLTKSVTIFDKVNLTTVFSDSTICDQDTIRLLANADVAQSFTWSPSTNNSISDANISQPLVFPKVNTTFELIAQNGDCKETAKVQVNMLGQLNLVADNLYECFGDSAKFNVATQANRFQWTSLQGEDQLTDYTIKEPSIKVTGSNLFHLAVQYGQHCIVEKDINLFAAPYPTIQFATSDTSICIGNSINLETTGTSTDFLWKPTNTKESSLYLPSPQKNTTYIIDAYDRNSYCAKHVQDTITVRLVKGFKASLTKDTIIAIYEPLLLNPKTDFPTRKYTYQWQPAIYLNSTDTSNPTVNIAKGVPYQQYFLTMEDEFGCIARQNITVHIFQKNADIYIPSAFTPNNDGKNDRIRPILAGIKEFKFLNIFDRWGQLVFHTENQNNGWNGFVNGKPASSGTTYIYHTIGIDVNNKKIEKRGTITLIR